MKGKLSKNVIWMGVVSLLTDVSSEMIFPILPLFLANILNASKSAIGIIEGLAESTASILKVFSGWLSDKLNKRKAIIVFGYSLSTIMKPLFAVSTLWQYVLVIRFFDRFGKGTRDPPRDALIAASTNKDVKGRAFGFHKMMDTIGAIIGTLAAFLLLAFAFNYRSIFWFSFIPGAIAVLVLIFFVKEIKNKVNNEIKLKESFGREFKIFVLISSLFSLGNFSYAFFILKAQEFVQALFIPIIYLLYNVSYALFAMPAGNLSDKFGRRNIIAIGYILFGIVAFAFTVIANSIFAWVLFIFYGISIAFREAVSRAYVTDLVDKDKRATAFGVFYMANGLVMFPASIIAGKLWDIYGSNLVFLYASVISIISAVLLLLLLDKKLKNN
ncbi:MAG: MFS transporter [Nanoarchaeota archaeon]